MLLVWGPHFGNHGFRFPFGTNMIIKIDPYAGKKIAFSQMIENILISTMKKYFLNFCRDFTDSLKISTKI